MTALTLKWPAIASRRRGVEYLERIRTLDDWGRLHARPGHHTVARTETVKFVIDLHGADKTYFLDTRKWEVHFDFVYRFLDPYADYDRFNIREYTQDDRRFVLGSLMHYLDGGHWTVELSGGDTLSAERIGWMVEHVAARVGCTAALKFRPVSPQQIAQAAWLNERVPVLSSEALNASVVYQPVVLGVAYGHVRLIRGSLDVSAVQPSDIVVSEWVPEQIPPVAGLVTAGEPILRDAELVDLTTQLLQIHRAFLAGHTGSANAMDVEFALTQARQFVMLQARPYRIVYSLDRAGRERPKTGLTQRVQDRLRRLADRLNRGWFRHRALGGTG